MRRCFNPSNHFGQFPPENPLNYRPPSDRTDQFTPQLFCIPSPRAANGTRLVRPSTPPPPSETERDAILQDAADGGGARGRRKNASDVIYFYVFSFEINFSRGFFSDGPGRNDGGGVRHPATASGRRRTPPLVPLAPGDAGCGICIRRSVGEIFFVCCALFSGCRVDVWGCFQHGGTN